MKQLMHNVRLNGSSTDVDTQARVLLLVLEEQEVTQRNLEKGKKA